MATLAVERDTEIIIDNQLKNLGWDNNPHSSSRNVFLQRVKTDKQKKKLQGKRPDYVLYPTGSDTPLAIIEAKKPGQNIHDAMNQGIDYAKRIEAPIVFATDGIYTKTIHTEIHKPLRVNGEELDELIRETLALRFLKTNDISTLNKKVIKSRGELISIFETVNDLLREEGLQKGLERFSEFSNILFLKVLSEIEDGKEEYGIKSRIDQAYRWNSFRDKKGSELLSYINDTVLKWFSKEYQDENLFQGLKIKHPDNLKEIIDLLDDLQLTDINADIKGDAFEYFIRSYSASNPSDLGEIFTPRHIVKTIVKLINPQIGETIYDPFCGTGGMLIVAFKHIMNNMAHTDLNKETLKKNTLYGAELTRTASIAKMNMILAGDGHNNIVRQDSLSNPVDDKYNIVITNYPFSQKTRYGDKYKIPNRNGDLICPQHCFRSIKEGGRMIMIAPDGFLTNKNSKDYHNVRKYLVDNANLRSVISLPRGSFEPYNRAKASILYFTDIKKKRSHNKYWHFQVNNDGYTLDKKRTPIEGISDLELTLSERDLEAQTNKYLIYLGITKIDFSDIEKNEYALNASCYIKIPSSNNSDCTIYKMGDLIKLTDQQRIGDSLDTPLMSITMKEGLIDQSEKFNKRIASTDISKYKEVNRDELVIGFPIDEGVIGFQMKYDIAAVSPAYKIWKTKKEDINIEFFDILLRSSKMKETYRKLMQGSVDRRRSIEDEIFEKIELPFPSTKIQEKVVSNYQQIQKNKNKIRKLEMKIQSDILTLW